MEGTSNGGMLYHEVQESKLCAVHCVNTVLQGPFFSEFDLAALASDLDTTERQMMLLPSSATIAGDFLSEDSHNVSLDGDFSIQVLQKALEVWDLQVIPLHSPVAEPAQIDPELENAFICHLHDHWFCIRRVNGEWYNFDSLFAAPTHLSKFYLSAYLDTLRGSGWSIFLVRGNFPKECPISASEASNGYGQWLLPEDADRITKSCNPTPQVLPPQTTSLNQQPLDLSFGEAEMLLQMEDEDLKAAIAASLIDASPAIIGSEPTSSGPSRAVLKSKSDTVDFSSAVMESELAVADSSRGLTKSEPDAADASRGLAKSEPTAAELSQGVTNSESAASGSSPGITSSEATRVGSSQPCDEIQSQGPTSNDKIE